jgi:hypothetical protein
MRYNSLEMCLSQLIRAECEGHKPFTRHATVTNYSWHKGQSQTFHEACNSHYTYSSHFSNPTKLAILVVPCMLTCYYQDTTTNSRMCSYNEDGTIVSVYVFCGSLNKLVAWALSCYTGLKTLRIMESLRPEYYRTSSTGRCFFLLSMMTWRNLHCLMERIDRFVNIFASVSGSFIPFIFTFLRVLNDLLSFSQVHLVMFWSVFAHMLVNYSPYVNQV